MAANSNAKPTTTKRRLGRGLSSLIRSTDEAPPVPKVEESATEPATGEYSPEATPPDGASRQILIDQIARNPYQPRRDFDESQLAELTQSVRQEGYCSR